MREMAKVNKNAYDGAVKEVYTPKKEKKFI